MSFKCLNFRRQEQQRVAVGPTKTVVISVSPIYCDNVDMLGLVGPSLNLVYTHVQAIVDAHVATAAVAVIRS